jgi:hypothetical protein
MTSQPEKARPDQPDAVAPACKLPGCGNPLPPPGRGRARQFCGDECARRYHNDARIPSPASPVTAGGAGDPDPLATLEALSRQAAMLIRAARAQAADLDPAHVRAAIADSAAARHRAEAAAVTAQARAAEAAADADALTEALTAARAGSRDAENTAREAVTAARAAEAGLAALRREAREQITAAADRARQETGTAQQEAARCQHERDTALQAARDTAHHADTEISRARQAETDARDETSRVRDDAARERDTLAGHCQAQLAAAQALTAAESTRAQRAEQQLEIERADRRQLTGHITGNGAAPPAPRRRTTPPDPRT